jgi:hypothetical protein
MMDIGLIGYLAADVSVETAISILVRGHAV